MSDSEIKTITEVIRHFLRKTPLCNPQIEGRIDDMILSDAIELCMDDPEYANKLGTYLGYPSAIKNYDDDYENKCIEFQMRVFYEVNCAYRQENNYIEDTSKKYPSDIFLRDNEKLQEIWEAIVLDHAR